MHNAACRKPRVLLMLSFARSVSMTGVCVGLAAVCRCEYVDGFVRVCWMRVRSDADTGRAGVVAAITDGSG